MDKMSEEELLLQLQEVAALSPQDARRLMSILKVT
jgi:hypothetical protein